MQHVTAQKGLVMCDRVVLQVCKCNNAACATFTRRCHHCWCCWCCCPADALDTRVAGVGLSIFNAFGAALGGFVGNLTVGALVTRMGSFVQSMVFMGVFLVASGVMMFGLWMWERFRPRTFDQLGDAGSELESGRTSGETCCHSKH